MIARVSPMNRLPQSPEVPLIRKRAVASLLYLVLALSCTDIQSSTVEPFRPATPEARAAFAQHAAKDGLQGPRDRPTESNPKASSQGSRDALNDRFAADMKSLVESEIGGHAAAFFLAFYTIESRIVPGVCRTEGVDLEAYSYAFQLKHAAVFSRADEFMSASHLRYGDRSDRS
jgi:hypothetical protein